MSATRPRLSELTDPHTALASLLAEFDHSEGAARVPVNDRQPNRPVGNRSHGSLADDRCHTDDYDNAGEFEVIAAGDVPPPFDGLLVHREHMTATLGRHHGRPVELRVLRFRIDGDTYSREIVLTPAGSETIVEYGIVRLDLSVVSPAVRAEIEARRAPLGDILIRHDVLRRIEPQWYLRFGGESPILEHFRTSGASEAYGRLGTIYCDEAPAIELLEVVADV